MNAMPADDALALLSDLTGTEFPAAEPHGLTALG